MQPPGYQPHHSSSAQQQQQQQNPRPHPQPNPSSHTPGPHNPQQPQGNMNRPPTSQQGQQQHPQQPQQQQQQQQQQQNIQQQRPPQPQQPRGNEAPFNAQPGVIPQGSIPPNSQNMIPNRATPPTMQSSQQSQLPSQSQSPASRQAPPEQQRMNNAAHSSNPNLNMTTHQNPQRPGQPPANPSFNLTTQSGSSTPNLSRPPPRDNNGPQASMQRPPQTTASHLASIGSQGSLKQSLPQGIAQPNANTISANPAIIRPNLPSAVQQPMQNRSNTPPAIRPPTNIPPQPLQPNLPNMRPPPAQASTMQQNMGQPQMPQNIPPQTFGQPPQSQQHSNHQMPSQFPPQMAAQPPQSMQPPQNSYMGGNGYNQGSMPPQGPMPVQTSQMNQMNPMEQVHQVSAPALGPSANKKGRVYPGQQPQQQQQQNQLVQPWDSAVNSPITPSSNHPLMPPGSNQQFTVQQPGAVIQPLQPPGMPEAVPPPSFNQGGYNQGPGMPPTNTYISQIPLQPFNDTNVALLASPPLINITGGPPLPEIRPDWAVVQSPHTTCPPAWQRSTCNKLPQTPALQAKSRIPLGLILHPYRQVRPNETPIPLIENNKIVRCRRCRTYINPYVEFLENGMRWKCNMCSLINDIPQDFDFDLDQKCRIDRWTRPELTHSVVEYVAPGEYMSRAPQPPVYLFVIDVSYAAVHSGMVATAAQTIMDVLSELPNHQGRTKIAFITVDSQLHFYSLNPALSEPQMLVVADLEDYSNPDAIQLPAPEHLLVLIEECRPIIDTFLGKLSTMFSNNPSPSCAMGCALLAAMKMLTPMGGKIVTLMGSMPNIHAGALKPRDETKLTGTPKESQLLNASIQFYKNLAIECSKVNVGIDMFACGDNFLDLASIGTAARFTAGTLYHYPRFNASNSEDALKLAHELTHALVRPLGFEAVLRVRASQGIRISDFYGNFFARSPDLLSLPNLTPDHAYTVQLTIDETLAGQSACFQTAILHTTDYEERRIRVITSCLPVTNNLTELYTSIDEGALAAYLSKLAIEKALTHRLEDARDAIMNKCVDLLTTWKTNCATNNQALAIHFPHNIMTLPLLLLGILRHVALRAGQISPDIRSNAIGLLRILPVQDTIQYIYPSLWELHTMPTECGTLDENGNMQFPPALNLSFEKIQNHGLYLMFDNQSIYIFIGSQAHPQLVKDVFDKGDYGQIPAGKMPLPLLENDFSQRVNNLIVSLRENSVYHPHIYIVKQEGGDPGLLNLFFSLMVEDRMEILNSYPQFLTTLRERIQAA